MIGRKRDEPVNPAASGVETNPKGDPSAGTPNGGGAGAGTDSVSQGTSRPLAEKKGRPTPRRRDREAERFQPLISADPKADKRRAKEKIAKERRLQQAALETGDETHMPAQHRGPARRWVRDYIDSRWGIGEFFMPVAMFTIVLLLITVLLQQGNIFTVLVLVMYLTVIAAIIEAVIIGQIVRKQVIKRFGVEHTRGIRLYAASRSMQMRRARLPKPQINRGETPR